MTNQETNQLTNPKNPLAIEYLRTAQAFYNLAVLHENRTTLASAKNVTTPNLNEDGSVKEKTKKTKKSKVNFKLEDVQNACKAHAKENGKEETYAILKEFDASRVKDLDKEAYPAVMEKLGL
jgi:hypothetical protein